MKNGAKRSRMLFSHSRTARSLRWIIFLVVVLVFAISAQAQNPGYIYTANETLNELDVLRASDHVLIASMPTISTPFGVALPRMASASTSQPSMAKTSTPSTPKPTRSSPHFKLDRSCARSRSLRTTSISMCRTTTRTLSISSRPKTTH